MLRLPNYEVAISAVPRPDAPPTPILALSFAWDDTGLPAPNSDWAAASSQCAITNEGLLIGLGDTQLLFPLDDGSAPSSEPGFPLGLPRDRFLSLMSSYQSLYVCAFDQNGSMIASVGFLLDT